MKPYAQKVFWVLVSSIIVIIGLVESLVITATIQIPNELPLALATALFSFGAIPLFILALKDFKHGLRRAYTLLCIGITLYGIGQLQFPLFEIIDGSLWVNSGAVILPYILSISCLFFGVRHFARLIGLKGLWLSAWLAYGSAAIIAVLSSLIINNEQATVLQFELFLSVILTFSLSIVIKIKKATAIRYHQSLTLLAASLAMLVVAALHHIATALLLPEDDWYLNSGLTLWPAFIAAFLFMRAGYSFAMIHSKDASLVGNASPTDVITYVASFASNPTVAHEFIAELHDITAVPTDSTILLSVEQQESALANLYTKLEDHLTLKDPLQKFTKESLRELVRTRFQSAQNADSIFWALFSE